MPPVQRRKSARRGWVGEKQAGLPVVLSAEVEVTHQDGGCRGSKGDNYCRKSEETEGEVDLGAEQALEKVGELNKAGACSKKKISRVLVLSWRWRERTEGEDAGDERRWPWLEPPLGLRDLSRDLVHSYRVADSL